MAQGMAGNVLIHRDVVNTYFAGAKISALSPFPAQRLSLPLEYRLYLKVIQQDEPILILFFG